MNGQISVASDYGTGSSFTFAIPAIGAVPIKTDFSTTEKSALVLLEKCQTTDVILDALNHTGLTIEVVSNSKEIKQHTINHDIVIATAETLKSLSPFSPDQIGIAISKLGDMELDALVKQGKVHEVITAPISTFAARNVLKRIVEGNPLGHALLAKSSNNCAALKSFAGAKILVADDSAVNREVVIQALGRFDISPAVVESGAKAIESFATNSYDLVFMDCSMPEMDGFEATVKLREHERNQTLSPTPIIALTAHIVDQIADKVQQSGMDDVVVKPFTIQSIGECLEKWLNEFSADKTKTINSTAIETPEYCSDDKIIDETMLDNLREISGDSFEITLHQLHKLYVENSPASFTAIRQAHEERNLGELAKASHALKSMSYNVGASKLGNACAELENASTQDNYDASKLDKLTVSVSNAYGQLMNYIRKSTSIDESGLPITKTSATG